MLYAIVNVLAITIKKIKTEIDCNTLSYLINLSEISFQHAIDINIISEIFYIFSVLILV